jgi:hypothetical protein
MKSHSPPRQDPILQRHRMLITNIVRFTNPVWVDSTDG